MICAESIIRYHQRQYFNDPTVEKPMKGIIFSNITRSDADTGVLSCIKFFANYFFYKFGLEVRHFLLNIASEWIVQKSWLS